MNENIIAVNVPNFITIVVMAAVGMAILGVIHKMYHGSQNSGG